MKILKIGSTTITRIELGNEAPGYEGAFEIIKIETPDITVCFRTADAETYFSQLKEIENHEFERLKKLERSFL